jgi:hypothetical protein
MKRSYVLLMLLIASCSETTSEKMPFPPVEKTAETPVPEKSRKTEKPEQQADEFPPISDYRDREYSTDLQREMDERTARRPKYTEIMTLTAGFMGQDVGQITLKDAKGKLHQFIRWPLEAEITFEEDAEKTGEYLAESEKGKRYQITYQLETYWFDSGAEVVENWTIQRMVPVS